MIDTYGMNDINTQAIRELTTEVDGIKRTTATNSANITTLLAQPNLVITTGRAGNLSESDLEISAGSVSNRSINFGTIPEGYTPQAVIVDRITDSEYALISKILVTAIVLDAENSRFYITLFNPTSEAITVRHIIFKVIVQK